jgi:hypothetical protein
MKQSKEATQDRTWNGVLYIANQHIKGGFPIVGAGRSKYSWSKSRSRSRSRTEKHDTPYIARSDISSD